jgi:hypothetical protein
MNETTEEIKNRNDAQRAYVASKKVAQDLLHQIERALFGSPAACDGNWGMVGDMNHLVNELNEIAIRLYGEGEYTQ